MDICQCRPTDWPSALRLLYSHLSADERDDQVFRALKQQDEGSIQLSGLFHAVDAGVTVGAALTHRATAGAVLIWPPRIAEHLPARRKGDLERGLFLAIQQHSIDQGAKLLQLVLSGTADELSLAESALAVGFQRITRLLYLERSAEPMDSPLAPGYYWKAYEEGLRPAFVAALEASYANSMDCPETSSFRSADESFSEHQSQGEFDPSLFRLVFQGDKPVAVLFMVEVANAQAVEVIYLGVSADARGQGLGRQLTRMAIGVAHTKQMRRCVLAVDDRNTPAIGLYASQGFQIWDQREVFLYRLEPPNTP